MNFKGSHIIKGLVAGLLGSLAAIFIFWGAWFLPIMGLALTRVNLIYGILTVLALGLLGGGLYSLIVGTRRFGPIISLLAGLALGAILWLGGFLLVLPVMLGQKPLATGLFGGWVPLVALASYGIIISLIYNRWLMMGSKRAFGFALGLILLSAFVAPVMLRAAFSTDQSDLEMPAGFQAQVIAKGLTYPTSVVICEDGNIFVAEAGFVKGPKTTAGRIVKIDQKGNMEDIGGEWNEPINGMIHHKDILYVSHRGKISTFNLKDGRQEDLVTGLPSNGDHQNNDLVLGYDGAIYIGQGTATNAGVVGPDNFLAGWLDKNPEFHDVPSRKFVLTGENYEGDNPAMIGSKDKKITGAFSPFGETPEEGMEMNPRPKASGAILRYEQATAKTTVYADGLRNPYGLAVGKEGQLYVTNHGYDDRGVRAVKDSPDWLVEIKEGAWYGWPDFAGTTPLSDQKFASEKGINRKPLIANQPEVEPPMVSFPPHYMPMKLSCAPANFPLSGIYVAIFGDESPRSGEVEEPTPTGIIRVDESTDDFTWFIKNKDGPRAGRFDGGLKRVVDVKFSPDGRDMYILDFGVMEFTDASVNAVPNSGVLWRVTPVEVAKKEEPTKKAQPSPSVQSHHKEHHQEKIPPRPAKKPIPIKVAPHKQVPPQKDIIGVPEKEPPVEKEPVEKEPPKIPGEEPPVEEPPTEESPTEEPPGEEPPANEGNGEESPPETPSAAETPSDETVNNEEANERRPVNEVVGDERANNGTPIDEILDNQGPDENRA